MQRSASPLHLATVASAALALTFAACDTAAPERAIAKRITDHGELIGGPGALGDVGDFLLANGQVRLVVQGEGYSRGFGVYGGGIIDADLQRPVPRGDSSGGIGRDNFSEMFPAIFLAAAAPRAGGIVAKEHEDGSASIEVSGSTNEFLFMLSTINEQLLGEDALLFKNEYRLRPGQRWVEITTSVTNPTMRTVRFPGPGIDALTGGQKLVVPVGDVLLFGDGNRVFTEQAGFDIRFTLEDLYKTPPSLPGLSGLIVPFIATTGPGVSYGYVNAQSDDQSFIKQVQDSIATSTVSNPANDAYLAARPDDTVVPFLFSAFTAGFAAAAPEELQPRETFSYKRYFVIGWGDVASIRDAYFQIRGITELGSLSGIVRDGQSLSRAGEVGVITYDEAGRIYNQHRTDSDGTFKGQYEPGRYSYRLVAEGRFTTEPMAFEVRANESTFVQPLLTPPGVLHVRVNDADGRPVPARCMVLGTYAETFTNQDPMDFLFELRVGEHRRPTDLVPDTQDPNTRQYMEQTILVRGGIGRELVRPGTYRLVCTRGPEYELAEAPLEIREGQNSTVDLTIHRAFHTPGWIAGDFHLHSINSVDSFMALDERVLAAAAEGLDLAVGTDHNFVTDFGPTVARLGLQDWVQSMVGLEMTTLEVGHFNGFPLRYDPGPITKGAFGWSGRPPRDIFEDLRALGKYGPENTVIQCNHPRDSILGYFNDYNWNQDIGEPEEATSLLLAPEGPEFGPENFDLSFDAIEIYNGKRFELLRNYRVPEVLPPPPLPVNVPPAGTVLRDSRGNIAFPGGIDDWYKMLELGIVKTAMGNSDSHTLEDETGYPRTYLPVSDDRPGKIPELDIVAAIKNGKAVPTNGPFIELSVGSQGIGELVNASAGEITVTAELRAASWVKVDRLDFVLNGAVVASESGDNQSLAEVTKTIPVDRDGWLLVEASGSESMWPVVSPQEVPTLQIADAVGSLAGSLGIDLNPYGNLQPNLTFVTRPFGFTNPVFLDFDGDGRFVPPGAGARPLRRAPLGPRAEVQNAQIRSMPRLLRMFSAFSHGGHH